MNGEEGIDGGGNTYEAQARVVGLGENRMLRLEDELGEEDLVLAFVDLSAVNVREQG